MEALNIPGSIIVIASMSGSIANKVRITCFSRTHYNYSGLGSPLGRIQREQSSRHPDGAFYGMRTGEQTDPRQFSEPWVHIHRVSFNIQHPRSVTGPGFDPEY